MRLLAKNGPSETLSPSSCLPGSTMVSLPPSMQALYSSIVSASVAGSTPIWSPRSSTLSARKLWPVETSSSIWLWRSASMSVESTISHISSFGCSRIALAISSRRPSSAVKRFASSFTKT